VGRGNFDAHTLALRICSARVLPQGRPRPRWITIPGLWPT
jgi:hypothetical protein